jgi:hypothetical protein
MAVITLGEMRDGIRTIMDLDETEMPDTTCDIFIKEAWRVLETFVPRWPFFDHIWSYDTVVGTAVYTMQELTDGLYVPRKITDVLGPDRILRYLPHFEAIRRYPPNYVGTGKPEHWSGYNQSIYLWPEPGEAETFTFLGYRQGMDWFVGDSSEPDCPEELHVSIFNWAVGQAYAQQEDFGAASYYNSKAADQAREIAEVLTQTPADTSTFVVSGTHSHDHRRLHRARYPFE